VLKVTDTGVGIDAAAQARLFEPFFTTKEAGKGSGFGLSVVFGIVKAHKGHITVDSERGQGSIFKVYIPLVGAFDDLIPAQSPSLGPIRGGTGTILVVEDDPDVRKFMAQVLTSLGYTVLEAEHADGAIQALKNYSGRIDLMVTDLVMPGLGGLELAKRLARMYPNMRLLYVSGYADYAIIADLPRSGGSTAAYLRKPFGPAELARKVAEVLSHSSQTGTA
jgi:CheY-like chemotaxis protein